MTRHGKDCIALIAIVLVVLALLTPGFVRGVQIAAENAARSE